MIKITANFDLSALDKLIQVETDKWLDSILEKYRKAGKQFVERARAKVKGAPFSGGGFGNITYDLRSSIGYLLMYNGKVIESHFPTVSGGSNGTTTGDAYAREIASSSMYNEGIALICVAGMEYAHFVEIKGYDVISGSSVHFDNELTQLLFAA